MNSDISLLVNVLKHTEEKLFESKRELWDIDRNAILEVTQALKQSKVTSFQYIHDYVLEEGGGIPVSITYSWDGERFWHQFEDDERKMLLNESADIRSDFVDKLHDILESAIIYKTKEAESISSTISQRTVELEREEEMTEEAIDFMMTNGTME